MNPSGIPERDEAARLLANLGSRPTLDLVLRTRRTVLEAANEMRAARARRQRQLCIVFFTLAALFTLLAPAIWSSVDDLFAGEHFFDLPAMLTALILLLFTAVVAVLILNWKPTESLREGRR